MRDHLPYGLFADLVMSLHIAVVAFVVGGLVLIIAGNLVGWRWVNSLWFRVGHAAAITVVVVEQWLGEPCPLTTLEDWLRVRAGEASYSAGFIEHWLQQVLHYEAPSWVFTFCYSLFALVVFAAWWYFPPHWRRGRK